MTTVSCQPADDQDAMYIALYGSIKSSSMPMKGKNWPFCEGFSGDIDDWSDYSINDPEEGLLCMQAMNLHTG